MTAADTATLAMVGALADLCRAKGVKSLSCDGVSLEMGPPNDSGRPDTKHVDADVCLCGHGLHAHNAGLCLHGCSVEKCAGPEVAT